MKRWRGLKALVHDAIDHTTDLIEAAHTSVARNTMKVLDVVEPVAPYAHLVNDVRHAATAGVLASVRLVNRTVQHVTDSMLNSAEDLELLPDSDSTVNTSHAVAMRSDTVGSLRWVGDAALGLVNGVLGDSLHARENGLDLGMSIRCGEIYLPTDETALRAALSHGTSRLVIFVHGLATTEWSWCLNSLEYWGDPATSFGTLFERDLGATTLYVRYNTGRHVSENGKQLAAWIERLVSCWPELLDEVILVGHSMGGLVVRSACHYARVGNARWVDKVERVFCLGSPHQGSPVEKLGNIASAVLSSIDLPGTLIPAQLLKARSAGIKDLRYGYLVDEEWLDQDPDALLENNRREVPLLDGVSYHFVSATVTQDPEHPLGQIVGDMLVRVASATSPVVSTGTFKIKTSTFGGVLHHQLQNHPDVYEQIRAACVRSTEPTPGSRSQE